jgi:hypothetical protein
MSCNPDKLLLLVRGHRVADVEAHVERCTTCRRELDVLRAEQGLFSRRAGAAPPPPARVWEAVARQVAVENDRRVRGRSRRLFFLRMGGLALFAAAAVVLVLSQRPRPATPAPQLAANQEQSSDAGSMVPLTNTSAPRQARRHVDPLVTLSKAEREYKRTITTLEAEYAELWTGIDHQVRDRYDREIASMRKLVLKTRAAADKDIHGRRRVLDVYAAYVKTLRTVLIEEGIR